MTNRTRIIVIISVVAALLVITGATILILSLNPDSPIKTVDTGSSLAEGAKDPVSEDSDDEASDSSDDSLDPGIYSEFDQETSWSDEDTVITCNGDQVSISGIGAAYSDGTVKIDYQGTYVFSGTLNGRILIDVADDEKVHLVLNGFAISCSDYSPILCLNADKVSITLADETENVVNDNGKGYSSTADIDEVTTGRGTGAVHVKSSLSINGKGSLTVNAGYHHGIFSSTNLKIISGTISVDASGSGIKGKKSISIANGTITIQSVGDGLKVTNLSDSEKGYLMISGGTIDIQSVADGIDVSQNIQIEGGTISVSSADHALTSDGTVTVSGEKTNLSLTSTAGGKGIRSSGEISIENGTISATGVEKGLDSANSSVTISGGTITIESTDDGIKAEQTVAVSGGNVFVKASGDGLDSNGNVVISGGTVVISSNSSEDDNALVCGEWGNSITISGGQLITFGAEKKISYPTSYLGSQKSVCFTGTFQKGKTYCIRVGDQNVVTFTMQEAATNICVSSSLLNDSETCSIVELNSDDTIQWCEWGKESSGGTVISSITISEMTNLT